jgi:hypothetical protein
MEVEAETEGRTMHIAHQDRFYVFLFYLMSYGRFFVLAGAGDGGIFGIFRSAAHITEKFKSSQHKVCIYLEYHSVCPLVRIGIPPPPLPQASPPPPTGGVPILTTGEKAYAICPLLG